MATIASLVENYRAGRTDPWQVIQHVSQLADQSDAAVWIHRLSLDEIRSYVDALGDKDKNASPLWGVPFAIKDNIDLAGSPTTAGCRDYAYEPQSSAPVVQQIIDAGGIPIGKTNLDQFATGLTGARSPYGIVKNAVDSQYISGGSSSGSAIAVASQVVPFALGTDTAGSGRIPAALNGIVGFKPSKGFWSTRGVVPACRSLDCVSVFTRTIQDASLVANVAVGFDPDDEFARNPVQRSFDVLQPKIGYLDVGPRLNRSNAEYAECYQRFISALPSGTQPVDPDPFLKAGELLYEGPWVAERVAAVGEFIASNKSSIHPVTRSVIDTGRTALATDCFRAQYRLAELKREAEGVFRDFDIVVMPTTTTHYIVDEVIKEPFSTNLSLGTYSHCMNLLDLCGVAVPANETSHGLPFGVTMAAPRGFDDTLLEAASLLMGENQYDIPRAHSSEIHLAVCGAHMKGLPLNAELIQRGGYFVQRTQTAPCYRLYALPDGIRPGLARDNEHGVSIELEVWAMPEQKLGSFLKTVAPPLAIGSVELADGRWVNGFVGDSSVAVQANDISRYGGWRRYTAE